MEELIYRIPDIKKNFRPNIYVNRVTFSVPTDHHSHDYVEIAFVESGSGSHRIGDRVSECGEGDLYLINHRVWHQFIPAAGQPLTVCNCVFLPDFFDYSLAGSESAETLSNIFLFRSFLLKKSFPYIAIHADGDTLARLRMLFAGICAEYAAEDTGYREMIRAHMIELIIIILREAGKRGDIFPAGGADRASSSVSAAVIDHVERHYAGDIRIRDLSDLVFLSPAQLGRVFRRTTGLTIGDFIRKTRMEAACRMLSETEKSVAEIARLSGYADSKHFSGLFARMTGMSPTAFRRSRRGT